VTEPIRKAAVSLVIDDKEDPVRILCVWNPRYRTWSLPGGMVEDGETPEEAQARELEEETAMLTRRAKLVHEGPHGLTAKPGRASVVCLFVVDAFGEPQVKEPECVHRWMTVEGFLKETAFREFYTAVLPGIVACEVLARRCP
jgi:ADP-ribose pyrophosphatase YjhB (NUDIX family)